jgi:penicillin-binding protein 2
VVWSRDLILPGLEGGRLILQREQAQRGDIIAADGSILATQSDRLTLGVRRSAIRDAAEENAMLEALSQVTGLSKSDIQARYANVPSDWFVPIADLDEDTLSQRSALIAPFAAVSARPGFGRVYNQTTLAPHVVGIAGSIPSERLAEYQARGYQGDEQTGLSGVEGYMETALAGQAGTKLLLARADGGISMIAERPLKRGLDVTLTISPPVQLAVQSILGRRRGAAVVLDARDGSVLAMVSNPGYDAAVLVDPGRAQERTAL